MKYLMKLILSAKEVIVVYILQYVLAIGASVIYYLYNKNNIDSFIMNILPYILMVFYLIVIAIILLKSKEEKHKLKFKNIYTISILGISIAVFINLIYFKLGIVNTKSNITLITLMVSSGLLGPIFEELMFRKIFLNNLLKFNSPKKAVIINTIVFSLIHGSIHNIIYAFILGLLFNTLYIRYKNIWASIIMHISANMVVLFINDFNLYMLLISFITLILSMFLVFKKYKVNN